MATTELELYYELKVQVALDVLDELDRIEIDPDTPAGVRENIAEIKPEWEREYTLARAQHAGVRSGQSTLPLPPLATRQKIAALSDEVERQINVNRAANAGIAGAAQFATMLGELKKLS